MTRSRPTCPNARGYILALTGGTDSVGDAQYNYQLSNRRADAVVTYLSTKYNIPPHKFYLIGIGKDNPVADNHTRDGRAQNRRVEVKLMSNMDQSSRHQLLHRAANNPGLTDLRAVKSRRARSCRARLCVGLASSKVEVMAGVDVQQPQQTAEARPVAADPMAEAVSHHGSAARPRRGAPGTGSRPLTASSGIRLEETYEVFDAIERRDWPDLKDELGDLLLQVLFYAQMAAEAGHFDIRDVAANLNAKLVRRHPHIFPVKGRTRAARPRPPMPVPSSATGSRSSARRSRKPPRASRRARASGARRHSAHHARDAGGGQAGLARGQGGI